MTPEPEAAADLTTLFFISLFFGLLGLVLFAAGLKKLRRKRLIENTPTSKARSVAMGRVEVEGTIVPFKEITVAPFSVTQCVYFRYSLEEHYTRTDKHGHRHEGWKTIDSGSWSVPFFVEDDTGKVLVDPRGSDIEMESDIDQRPLIESEIPVAVASRIRLPRPDILRYNESFLRPGDHVFVLGFAGDNPHLAETQADSAAADKMIQGRKGYDYFIADRSQKALLAGEKVMIKLMIFGGAPLFVVSLLLAIYAFGPAFGLY